MSQYLRIKLRIEKGQLLSYFNNIGEKEKGVKRKFYAIEFGIHRFQFHMTVAKLHPPLSPTELERKIRSTDEEEK